MRQLIQDPKAGTVLVVDVPPPAIRPGTLLVRTEASVISPGTERNAVAAVRDSYIRTARARPDLVRRVLDSVRRDGLLAAYRKVQAKLSEPQALGYACAGKVVAIGEGAGDHFRIGDRVACAGVGHASHAEMVCVPVNLAARIPDGVPLADAAFATLGAIALHGVRQAEPRLGDRVAVIGTGILGLLTVQLLRAHGARAAAFDLSEDLVERARALGAETGSSGGVDDQVATALAWTDGLGVDAVIVTAASASDGPMTAAAGMTRDRGRVVAVGFVPFGLPREIAYVKELELRISRSYGPGRYDLGYEETGVDYPIGYVRWTETRNLEAFLALLADGRVTVADLVTHRYALADAPAAYDELVAKNGRRPLGMVIDYPVRTSADAAEAARMGGSTPATAVPGRSQLAVVGAGAFARAVLLPALARLDVPLVRVATSHGLTALDAQKKFGFRTIGTDPEEVFRDPDVDAVVIATRHDAHADLAARALAAGKHVFVEKPLALTLEELDRVMAEVRRAPGILLVGFNRRFAAMSVAIRDHLRGKGPFLATYRINAGALPAGHWTLDRKMGGGRIIGECCHFVDLLSFLAGDAPIVGVQARAAGRPAGLAQDVAVQVEFGDGSVGQILYTSRGSGSLSKERLEVHAGGSSAVLDDFRTCTVHAGRSSRRAGAPGKGHVEELRAFVDAVRAGGPSPIAPATLEGVSRATIEIHRALTV
ncbi:MAG TPA: bi-domain-containing oxidoreductase [Candidatus Polarisedimenticolaceae bacterium]|nr:bi-domain-containing oxidoreductase [Candidatus Polarisedimenticolaceae bacterium]